MIGRDAQTIRRWVEREAGDDQLSLTFERSGGGGSERLALASVHWRGIEWLAGHNSVVVRPGRSERPAQYLEEQADRETWRSAPAPDASLELGRAAFPGVRLLQARRGGDGSPNSPFEERRLIWMVDGAFAAAFDLLRCQIAGEYTVGVRWETPIAEARTARSTQQWALDGTLTDEPGEPQAGLTLAFPHEGWFAAEGAENPHRSGQVLAQIMARRFREGMLWSVGNVLLPHRGGFSRAERLPVSDPNGRKAHPRAVALAVRIGSDLYACGASAGTGFFTYGRGLLATDAETFVWWQDVADGCSHFFFANGGTLRVARAGPPPSSVRILVPSTGSEAAGEETRHLLEGPDWSMDEDGLTVYLKVAVGHVEIHDDLEA